MALCALAAVGAPSEVRAEAPAASPFTADRFHFAGFAQASFEFTADSGPTFASVALAPVLLWRLHDRVSVEAELDFAYAGGAFDAMLEYAQLNLVLADPVTVVGGLFFLPLGIYSERLHPGWINRSIDPPYPYQGGHHGGAFPMTGLGAQARGALRLGSQSTLNFAAFVINGPGAEDGMFSVGGGIPDNNWNKFVGGRVGFLPVRPVEIGISGGTGRWDDGGRHPFHVLVVDAMATFAGIHVQGEYATTTLELLGGKRERRHFGWAELAWRWTTAPGFLNRFELVARWGGGLVPEGSMGDAESALTSAGPVARFGIGPILLASAGHGATGEMAGTDPSAGLPSGSSHQIGGNVNLYLTPSVVLRVGGHYTTNSREGYFGAAFAAGL